ncbi:MAG: dihydrolipoyl dehydrogenase [Gammaproteobacteria bacterium]|nr:dihydrolipoyl dehydrogenase [Gammaproteobacteria bacterium]
MSTLIEVLIPDLGDLDSVPIIEIFVNVGDVIEVDDPLIALESDKATMEIPSTDSGVVREILCNVGDSIAQGQLILKLETQPESPAGPQIGSKAHGNDATEGESNTKQSTVDISPSRPSQTQPISTVSHNQADQHAQLVVLGSGPGGYTAAFRAADLGLKVILVERYENLGGVCLNVGCIPSKALLHIAKVINEGKEASNIGINYTTPSLDLDKAREWKSGIVKQLTQGLVGLAKKRKVTVISGEGKFTSPKSMSVANNGTITTISFDQAIIAAGSEPVEIPSFPHDDPRVLDSTGALELTSIPDTLLVIGGGIIGLEMATVYNALGTKVTIVEMMDSLMAGADPDLVRPLLKRIKGQYENIWLKTKVTQMLASENGIDVSFEGPDAPNNMAFEKVLVSVGRTPNGGKIDASAAGVSVTERGFIEVDDQQKTNVPHIFAIGDIVGQPMLAHKAVHEGKVAAEVAAGLKSGFDARVIPSVAYTDPEVAWVGLTETEAKTQGIDYGKGSFPWAASGRALTQDRPDGVTKLLFDKNNDRLIGAGITGTNAGDLIAEATLAIEMGADAQDIGLTIHPHPTLAETLGFAAEMFEGTITDLYAPKKKKT